MSGQKKPTPDKKLTGSSKKIAISQSTLQAGKITQQQYDDIVKRNYEKLDRFEENAPGNGD